MAACGADAAPEARCSQAAAVDVVDAPLHAGALFDAFVEEPEEGVAALACRMEDEGVEKAGLAVALDPRGAPLDEVAFHERAGEVELSFVPFAALAPGDVSRGEVERLLRNSTLLLRGIGPVSPSSLAAPAWDGVLALAGERGLFVVMGEVDLASLDAALTAHPDARVVLLASDPAGVAPLLRAHPNLLVVVTAVAMLDMHTGSAREFVTAFDATWPFRLEAALSRWRELPAVAPQQVMWGTGMSEPWQLEPEVYGRLIAFSRALIERLPPAHGEPFAVSNARRLLGGEVPEELV